MKLHYLAAAICASLALLTLGTSVAHAQSPSSSPSQRWDQRYYYERGNVAQVESDRISVDIVDQAGREFDLYEQRGKYFVAGENGQSYSLKLRNEYGRRILVVISVDGVNAISGQTASSQQTGYVLEPGQTAIIDGWRKSYQDVARFYFTYPEESYAAQTGRAAHVGVIGLAVFDEKQRPIPSYDTYEGSHPSAQASGVQEGRAESSAKAQSNRSAAPSAAPGLGTGHGERISSRARATGFERSSRFPVEVIEISYDTRRNLRRMGVIKQYRKSDRNPFPSDQFVPDPYR